MIDRLFVYGTLAPGQPNEHVLTGISGSWEPATIRGKLFEKGWGAALGYPGVVLDESGSKVAGLVFNSAELSAHWQRLDEFEGDGYERLVTAAELEDGTLVQVNVYALKQEPDISR